RETPGATGRRRRLDAPHGRREAAAAASKPEDKALAAAITGLVGALEATNTPAALQQPAAVALADAMGAKLQIDHINQFLRALKKKVIERAQGDGIRVQPTSQLQKAKAAATASKPAPPAQATAPGASVVAKKASATAPGASVVVKKVQAAGCSGQDRHRGLYTGNFFIPKGTGARRMLTSGVPAALPALCVALIAGLGWRTSPPQPVPEPPSETPLWLDGVAGACIEASSAALRDEAAARAISELAAASPPPPPPPGGDGCVCPEVGDGLGAEALALHLLVSLLSPVWVSLADSGARARVSYDGDIMDHGRVVVWPSRRVEDGELVDPRLYWVLSPDGDLWEELLSGASPADGPSGGERIANGGAPPADGRTLYSFRERPSLARLVELADECRLAMEARGQVAADGPAQVELASGRLLDGGDVFPRAAPARPSHRLRGKQALPVADGGVGDALADAATGSPTPPPEGHVWALAEPVPDLGIGAGVDALWLRRGRALRLELMPRGDVAGWRSRRVAELSRLLEVAAPVAAPGSPPPDGALETAAASGAEGSPGPDGVPSAVALADAASDDTRTLWVEWDDQGERYKEFRKAVNESLSYEWGHQRLEGGLACLHTCKMMHRTAGTPRAWLEKFLRDKNIAPTDRVAHELRPLVEALEEAGCFDQVNLGGLACLEADELMAPSLRNHVSRRAKEDWEVEQSMKKAEAVDARVAAHHGADGATTGAGGGDKGRGASTLDKHAALQQHLLREAHRRQAAAPGAMPKAEAALRELLRGQSVYETDSAPRNLVSYQPGKVSLPDSVLDCRFIEDIVSPGCRSFWEENHKRMRLEPETVDFDSMPRLYMDPVLKRNSKSYRTFLRDLAGVQLLSSEGFGRIEIELPLGVLPSSVEGQRLLGAFTVYVATTDVKDCFYRMHVREDFGRYFCLPAVPKHVLDGIQVAGVPGDAPPDALVRPYLAVLPMGFAWSLYLAQAANEDRVCRSPSLCRAMPAGRQQPLIQDQAEAFVLRAASRGVGGACVHVDNLGADSDNADFSDRMVSEWSDLFESVGLALHKSESHGGAGEALGAELDGARLRSGITSSRFWKLERGLTGLLARGRCSGQALEQVIGHCTFCGLAARESLSIFHTVYKFISVQYFDAGSMWPEVVEELVAFRGVLLLLGRDWWLPWNPCVLETDASLAGWAMAQSFWEPSRVASVGRVSERSRFKRVGAHSARESALTSAHLFRDESGSAWKTVRKGVWGRSEGILVLEARALVKAIRRSQDFKLLVQIRRFNAYALALGIAPYFSQALLASVPEESVPTDARSGSAAAAGSIAGESSSAVAGSAAARTGGPGARSVKARLESRPRQPPLAPSVTLDDLAPADGAGDDEADAGEGDESSGSDSVVNHATAASRRSRRLQDSRRRRRAALYTDMIMQTAAGGPTLLERLAVIRRTRERYAKYIDRFYLHAGLTDDELVRSSDETVDRRVCDYFTAMYLSGEQSSLGDQTGAALIDRHPAFGRRGGRALPRTWRALKAWRRLTPSRTRRALPLAVWSAVMWRLVDKGLPFMALFLAVGPSCGPATYLELSQAVQLAAAEIGAGKLTLYQLRHSGASIDASRRTRSLGEIRRRGCWVQAKSMHRYEHGSRLSAEYERFPADQRRLYEACE
ncbi:unnamed protein product, partial [Prorocentrum cordatum]